MIRLLILSAFLVAACSKSPGLPTPPGLREYVVLPSATSTAISTYNEPHYAYIIPDDKRRNQLLVFLPGTGAEPKNYRKFIRLAASKGYHAIGLMYPNEPAINQICAGSGDVTSHSRARLEIIDGTDRHAGVNVNTGNSINQRLLSLLQYLHKAHPEENWAQYISSAQPAWEKIVMAGHSQGAGHAAVMGKTYPLHRAILFSGMDFLTNGLIPDWVQNTTRSDRFYALHHEQDELLDIDIVKNGWSHLAMGTPATADQPIAPASRALTTKAAPAILLPSRFHNMTVVDVYAPASITDNAWVHFLQ